MRHQARNGVVAVVFLLVAACGSSPKERFYALSDTTREELRSLPSQEYGVAIAAVHVPDAVDRPQLVLRMPGNEVRIAEQARWAEPLRQSIARAVAANLAHSLNNGRVSPRAQPGTSEPDYRVILDVQRFDSALGREATLEVMWTVRRRDGGQEIGRTRVREPVSADGYDALVTAHARAIAEVSRSIAQAIELSRQKDVAAAAANGESRGVTR